MKKLSYSCALGSSVVYIGNLEEGWSLIPGSSEAPIITSDRLRALYPATFRGRRCLALPDGEAIKSLDWAARLYHSFVDWKLDRFSHILGLGGGEITDLVGFVASTYLRGIPFSLIPTTLLGQADAAVGGKTAIDLGSTKNVVGTFALPRATFIDVRFLLSLPEEEVLGGLAEVVKHALIASTELFSFLEENWARLMGRDLGLLEEAILRSVEIKTRFVVEDGRESGRRRTLNFGHTLAHAVEKSLGLSHGQAVAWGMALATGVSSVAGFLDREEARQVLGFLRQRFPFLKKKKFSWPGVLRFLDRIEMDKKKAADSIYFVFLRRIGEAEVNCLPLEELKGFIDDLCQPGRSFF